MRVDIIGAGQQEIFLRAALSAALNELIAVLKIVGNFLIGKWFFVS
jgi:hypothetical protein